MKILIILFSSSGDIVLATPVFRCIKKQISGAALHFLSEKKFERITASNPYVDKFWYDNDHADLLLKELKLGNFDVIIDLQENARSRYIKKSLHTKSYSIRKLNFRNLLLTKIKINSLQDIHFTTRALRTVTPIGIQDDGEGLDYFVPEKDRVGDDDLPFSHIAGYIALVMDAGTYTRKMPVHKLKKLCLKLDYPIVLVGNRDEAERGNELASQDAVKIYNACGKFNLNESADIIRKSKVVISPDTALLYIACAFQKPVVAIWGGTFLKLGREPYYGQNFLSRQYQPVYFNIVLNFWGRLFSKYVWTRRSPDQFNFMKKKDINLIIQRTMELLKR